MFRQRVEGFGLENYQAACEFERLLRPSAFRQITVEVRAGQRDDQWPAGTFTAPTFDRVVTAKRVQGNEQVVRLVFICLRDCYAMSELSQNLRPAQRRDAIAVSRARWSGCDDANPQDCGLRSP